MIIEHPTKRYTGPPPYRLSEICHVVECDLCSKRGPVGHEIHDAVTRAQQAGFETIPGQAVTDPRLWACPRCLEGRGAR
jgi:hypothetical protein